MSLLEDARKRINEVDKEIARLFEKRMQAVEDVARYKQEHALPVLDQSREQEVLDRNVNYIENEKYKDSYLSMMKDMMRISRNYQQSLLHKEVVGYQGVEGAFSSIAAKHLFPHYKKRSYTSFEDVIKAVISGEIEYGVLPVENSYSGEVGEVIDLLMKYEQVYIQQIYDLKISQNLLGIKGAKLEDIQQVYSKDQAISQSKQFLEGRGYELISYPNTAMAAEYVARMQDKTKAAIGAKENAELYGLEVLVENINTSMQNTTRFIVVGRELTMEGNEFSVIFSVPHKAGTLVSAMNIIARQGFNMESILSRAMKDKPWEYYFYAAIDGELKEKKAQKMLKELQDVCESVRVAGTYKKEGK